MIGRLIGLFLLLLLALVAVTHSSGAAQQNAARITYGETIAGEITDAAPEWAYTFAGAAGDIIVVEMRSVDRSLTNPLIAPNLILRDPAGNLIADTAAVYPVDDTTLVAELPVSGDFFLVATREGGSQGTSRGAFHLTLHRVMPLSPETVIEADQASDGGPVYYTPEHDRPFILMYWRLAGDYAPSVSVNRIERETGALIPLSYAGGSSLAQTCLGVFDHNEALVIVLASDGIAADLALSSVSYRLQTLNAECSTSR